MGYRDDFYIKDNILGYTGDLSDIKFTVYFADAGRMTADEVVLQRSDLIAADMDVGEFSEARRDAVDDAVFVDDVDGVARLEQLEKHRFRPPRHRPAGQMAKQGQSTDDHPEAAALE